MFDCGCDEAGYGYHHVSCPNYSTQEGYVMPPQSNFIDIYSPEFYRINPNDRILIDLKEKLNFKNFSCVLPTKELSLKGITILNHNFYDENETEKWILLYNLNPTETAVNSYVHLFGFRNKVDIRKGDLIGKLYLK